MDFPPPRACVRCRISASIWVRFTPVEYLRRNTRWTYRRSCKYTGGKVPITPIADDKDHYTVVDFLGDP